MKKVAMIICAASMIMCTEPQQPVVDNSLSACTIPEGIPDTLATGEHIDWDCDWQASYNAGNVKFVFKGDEVTMVYRTTSK